MDKEFLEQLQSSLRRGQEEFTKNTLPFEVRTRLGGNPLGWMLVEFLHRTQEAKQLGQCHALVCLVFQHEVNTDEGAIGTPLQRIRHDSLPGIMMEWLKNTANLTLFEWREATRARHTPEPTEDNPEPQTWSTVGALWVKIP